MTHKFPSFMTASFTRQPPEGDEATTSGNTESESASQPRDTSERRVHQRFVAKLHGKPCFWVLIGEERLPLNDLSLKGFALPAPPMLLPGVQFYFILQREGVPDSIRGCAEVTGVFGNDNPSAGCRIIQFEGQGEDLLYDWLVTHVIRSATVRISEKDAAAIVSGRSLV
ncbi:MAG: PilZ domain-containing protein [Betaproteobacteria bacterium]|nr:PilZ domain-containing protein [Betaproteobacteria bacterium]